MSTPIKSSSLRYVIVSPMKDEERYVEHTLRSVVSQTLRPVQWVLVDDGSKDKTPAIVRRYVVVYPFIRLVQHGRPGFRQTGSAVMRAFNYGYNFLQESNYDFIVKLDCDLSFESYYFEKLIKRFFEDEKLGIASGVYLEMAKADVWKEVVMPSYHAAGACKVLRRKCFEDIGGFISAAGWDTVDEIRAMTLGWKTGHFPDLKMKHHKPEGSGIGSVRTSAMHGEVYYLTGGGKFFFLLKVLHRMGTKPYVISAMALFWGYVKVLWRRGRPLVTKEEAICYQNLLSNRLRGRTKALFARASASFYR